MVEGYEWKASNSILTNQDKAMKVTISIVFPNTRHRLCIWHILKKIPKKLTHVIKKDESFMRIFKGCVYTYSWRRTLKKNNGI